jgi:hypothetical protein
MRTIDANELVPGDVIIDGGHARYEVDFVGSVTDSDVRVEVYDRVYSQLEILRYLARDLVTVES